MLCSIPLTPSTPPITAMRGREGEKGGWFSYCRFSQKHCLRCIFESKESIWEAVPGNTSPGIGKVRQEREGRQ